VAGMADARTRHTATLLQDGTVLVAGGSMSPAFPMASSRVELFVPPMGLPGEPTGLTVSASGDAVTLSWLTPQTGGPVAAYFIEAGSRPGLADLAGFSTGGTTPTFSTSGVPDGDYYLRVRAINAAGMSAASTESRVTVQTCTGAPGAPLNLRVTSQGGGQVTLVWDAPPGTPRSYLLEVGSAPARKDVEVTALTGVATSYQRSGNHAGTYYVRIRAVNFCGIGPASNEIVVIVGGPAAVSPGPPDARPHIVRHETLDGAEARAPVQYAARRRPPASRVALVHQRHRRLR
jgi:predicted phage tail protein